MVSLSDDKSFSQESKESKGSPGESIQFQEGVVKQIQAQLREQALNKYKKQDDAAKIALDQAYVKAQVEKIESVLKSVPPPPPPPAAPPSRFKRLGWSSSSTSIGSGWQSPVMSLSKSLGFSGAQSPKTLSRQNSLASTATARQSFRAVLSSSESMKEKKVPSLDMNKTFRLPEESSEKSSEERKDDQRLRAIASPRRVSKSPVAHSASRYLRTSLEPTRATTPQSARARSPYVLQQLQPPTPRNPTPVTQNRSLLARVASPFGGRPKSASARLEESDATLGSKTEVAIASFPTSKLTVKRMSSSMIQRSKLE